MILTLSREGEITNIQPRENPRTILLQILSIVLLVRVQLHKTDFLKVNDKEITLTGPLERAV